MNMTRDRWLTEPGTFILGCNYWASHAGTRMWRDWKPDIVERDLKLLSGAGLRVLRVFPLWPDFQPLHLLRGHLGRPVEYRHGEEPLPDDAYGRAGLDAAAMRRFGDFLDLAERHQLRLMVSLLTGWMSGRLFVPPALEGLNPITDARALHWELRFVRAFVEAFRRHSAILAWDLGNECNCMGAADRDQAAAWTAAIATAIRAADPTRPVVSGMHGLAPVGSWTIQDQAEWTDLLTVHPYPVFTPHCDQDPVNTMRPVLHGTAEARLYADIGGKPCLCQEIGTLGPFIAGDDAAAGFIRGCLFSLWANDGHGLLWWCAHDQTGLAQAPYDWCAVERELGLFRADGKAKPVVRELGEFRDFLRTLPFDILPPRRCEAVCILSDGQDHWGVAYSSFILAKQAGFDLRFHYETQPLADAPLYLLPCISGHRILSRRRLLELLAKVEQGATLYLSLDDALPSGFEALTGLRPETRERRRECGVARLDALPGAPEIPCGGAFKTIFTATRATVLGREADGNPAFSVAEYGKGRVYFLSVPMESMLARQPGAFHDAGLPAVLSAVALAEEEASKAMGDRLAEAGAPPCWQVYRFISEPLLAARAARKSHPLLAVTEHPWVETMSRRSLATGGRSPGERLIVAVNHSATPLNETLSLNPGWELASLHRGCLRLEDGLLRGIWPSNDAIVFEVRMTHRKEPA